MVVILEPTIDKNPSNVESPYLFMTVVFGWHRIGGILRVKDGDACLGMRGVSLGRPKGGRRLRGGLQETAMTCPCCFLIGRNWP